MNAVLHYFRSDFSGRFCLILIQIFCLLAHIHRQPSRLWVKDLQDFSRPLTHPRRPGGSQSGWEKRRDERFQKQAENPLGTDYHRTIARRSSECWLLIGHKKCFVFLCPTDEQHRLSSFRAFVHDCYCLALLYCNCPVRSPTYVRCACKENFPFLLY